MQRRDLEPQAIEHKLARATQMLRAYGDNGQGYLQRDGELVTDPAEIAYVKDLIQQVDQMWTFLAATRASEADLERGSRSLH